MIHQKRSHRYAILLIDDAFGDFFVAILTPQKKSFHHVAPGMGPQTGKPFPGATSSHAFPPGPITRSGTVLA